MGSSFILFLPGDRDGVGSWDRDGSVLGIGMGSVLGIDKFFLVEAFGDLALIPPDSMNGHRS